MAPMAGAWSAFTRDRRLQIGAGAGVAILAVILTVALASGGSDDSDAAGAGGADSSHDVCVRQLMAATENLANNQAYQEEQLVGGQFDPYYQAAVPLAGKVITWAMQDGSTQATERARDAAEDLCSNELDDEVRPNYPTDGSHP